ncbi:forkhead box Q2 [Osmerus eperlanus]|uniref:forkhead box Q2 n=1 Tax=Osmerus eperlanus TaxID=29151 RepID=UPI002E166C01
MEEGSSCSRSRERLGLRFTIDYLLYNKGDKQGTRDYSESPIDKKKQMEEVEEKEEGEEEKKEEVLSPRDSSDREWRSPKCQGVELESSDQENQEVEVPEEENQNNKGSLEEDKPVHSYIALISMAILSSLEKKLLLCDIYQWIMDHYPYFKSKDKNWRNSVRHNLSLNECFMKAGRSDNGKGHFWAVHPSNYRDFSNGDYHRRRARRRIRRMGAQPPYAPLGTPGPYCSPLPRLRGAGGPCWPPPSRPPSSRLPILQAPILQAPILQAPILQAPILQAPIQFGPHPVWLRG